ncbi:DoxX family membrane protein [Halovenus sp. WSH3]|uniref:DoxX family membrane protein n=1 Tax=Halovenus carboxidivorans TaxID=2692199 RepID=A0A6B0T9E9_9EURY|nr:DoxX family protein [Halovenus carboxidivorans]MXR51982.1 DoxX family membrane protein [Halovenus carboxidivorans]
MIPQIDLVPLQLAEQAGGDELFLVTRVLFGAVLAFMGLNHFMQVDQMAQYASFKGLPAPKLSVIVSGLVLVGGGLGIVLGVAPVLAGAALAGFLLIAAVTMHDFWAVDEEDQQTEMTQFLKNIGLAGGALSFVVLGLLEWPYAVNIGLF